MGARRSTHSKGKTESVLSVQVPRASKHQSSKSSVEPAGQQGGRRHLVVRAEVVQQGLQQHKVSPRQENLGWDLSISADPKTIKPILQI